ncbi:hypothetical protein [Planobispora takensis]|uniref:Uncharacterized protein n=1 Tax=Planobispora takensis TaxID=1367882 RepID=A0A8J3WYL4_9ACTN|nr:hypothetical protein [Planobispora takensis]GII03907.1 hypothetical protein Pta02_59150 [Planobispora takensis]
MRRHLVVAAVVVAVIVVGAAVWGLAASRPEEDLAAVFPPITPTVTGSAEAGIVIPEGFLAHEDDAGRPLGDQPEVRWERTDEPGLPPLLNPCETPPAEDGERVAGRQIALVAPTLYKIERMTVYRDEYGARAAMAGHRGALDRCARRTHTDGTVTVWRWEPLAIGQEALFVAGQRYRDDRGTHGHYRGVVMRQGRTVVTYLDFGQATAIAERPEAVDHERDARTMASRIAAAPWAGR